MKKSKGRKIRKIEIYRSSKGWSPSTEKENWIHVDNGYVYLSYKHGRSYWLFTNGATAKIRFNEKKLQMSINTYKIKFTKKRDYDYAKKNLENWSL